MRIQIASDLHLEARPKATFMELLEPEAPILALLGDVAPLACAQLRPFLEWCSERWETVLWIPGCAELLGPGSGNEERRWRDPDISAAVARMRALAEPFWNVTVLDHEGMVSTDGFYLFGLPFWRFPRDEGHVWNPQFYRYVEAEPSPADAAVIRAWYNADIRWLQDITKQQREPIVILSHYGPVTWLQEEGFLGDPDRSTVFPDMEQILRTPIVAWLCGHCHQSVQSQKEWADVSGESGTVLLATNPKGMIGENLNYRREAVVRLDRTLFRV